MGAYQESQPRIPLNECVKRRLYRIGSRNISLGVFVDGDAFMGIRQKFSSRFIDVEQHWDVGPPYGTVYRIEDTGIDLPDHINLEDDGPLLAWLEGQDDAPST